MPLLTKSGGLFTEKAWPLKYQVHILVGWISVELDDRPLRWDEYVLGRGVGEGLRWEG